jgi:hypothetical protein
MTGLMMKPSLIFFMLLLPLPALAAEVLPAFVTQQIAQPLKQVGSGVYKKLGFTVYRATLWTPSGKWKPAEPYALQIHYQMNLSKDTVVDAVVKDIRDQNVASKATFAKWKSQLSAALPKVFDGDSIIGLAIPNQSSTLIHNGKVVTTIRDHKLSDAFFAIWLGKTADKKLKQKLLGV